MKTDEMITGILPTKLYAQMCRAEAIEVLDVSTVGEFVGAHVDGACNVPIDSLELEQLMGKRVSGDCPPLYVMCAGGVRSLRVCRQFSNANLVNIEGGLKRWRLENLPIVSEKNVMELARRWWQQVRDAGKRLQKVAQS